MMDAFHCLCTFTVAFRNVLTGCMSRLLCSFVLKNIKSFLVRGQEICLFFDTCLLDYLIFYYFKISE